MESLYSRDSISIIERLWIRMLYIIFNRNLTIQIYIHTANNNLFFNWMIPLDDYNISIQMIFRTYQFHAVGKKIWYIQWNPITVAEQNEKHCTNAFKALDIRNYEFSTKYKNTACEVSTKIDVVTIKPRIRDDTHTSAEFFKPYD